MEGAEETHSLLVGADEDGGGPLAAGQQLLSGAVPALAGERCPERSGPAVRPASWMP